MERFFSILLVVLLVPSLGGYLLLLRRIRRDGGAVSTKQFGGPELVVTVVLGSMLGLLSFGSVMFPAEPPPRLTVHEMAVSSVVELAVVGGMVAFLALRGSSIVETFGLRRQPLGRVLAYGLGLLVLAYPMVLIASEIVRPFLPKQLSDEQAVVSLFREGVRHHQYGGIVQVMILAAMIAPLCEEFMFRGYFYPVLKRYFGAPASAVFTSVLFALVHVNAASFAALLLLALCFTMAYEWTGSLLVGIVMHALFNSSELAALYYSIIGGP